MPIAFTGDASFSGINGTGGLRISAAVHQGFIDIQDRETGSILFQGRVVDPSTTPA